MDSSQFYDKFMFIVYHSNQLDLLKSLTSEIIKKEPLNFVFQPETILVQSGGMAKWLQMQLADDLRIAANITFTRPSQFIWKMYHLILSGVPEKNIFEKEYMVWKLMQILPDIITLSEFSAFNMYLNSDDKEQKCYQLAVRIADLYVSYLVYRPEWINKWEQGEVIDRTDNDELWQAKLWVEVIKRTKDLSQPIMHRANIYKRFIAALQQPLDPVILAKLPKRLFIFGIVSLPPLVLTSLSALAKHINVYLMLTNPCRWYWGEIPDEKWQQRLLRNQSKHYLNKSKRGLLKSVEKSQPNPLLASWGKLGRDNLFLLQNYSHKEDVDAFVDIKNDSLLHSLQQHILDLEDKSVIGHDAESFNTSRKKIVVSKDDFSVSFHTCHSELREVEVLYNYLLHMFDNDQQLDLHDVVVMVADIDRYALHIQAVFGSAPTPRYLPFSISDRKIQTMDPVVTAFLSLLNLPDSRFTTEDLFDLLAVPAIANQFVIDEKEIKQLREWSIEAGIRWGLNDEMLTSLNLPNTGRYTWHFGLTRMLLGYVMNSEQGDWQSIVPFDASSGLAAALVGKLATFLAQLTKWYHYLVIDKTLLDWQSTGDMILSDFFYKDSESEPTIILLENAWQGAISEGIEAGYDETIALSVIKNLIKCRLDHRCLEQRFLAGKINFCTLIPMRSVPFNVVCLLGMNDGTYPRLTQSLSFDLMDKRPERGDRNRRDDDRYLFLEAILAAQKKLYVSYIGHNIKDNSEHYPSILVDELRNYLAHSFVLEVDKALNIDDSAKRLIKHLTLNHPRTPFNAHNYVTDESRYFIGSYAQEWLPAARRQGVARSFLTSLPPLQTAGITVDELKQFYRHPIRTLMQKRLGVFFSFTDDVLLTTETFKLNGLERYLMNQQLLTQLINDGGDIDKLIKRIKSESNLPSGAFGEFELTDEYQKMDFLAKRVLTEKLPRRRYEVNLDIQGIKLEGWLLDVQQDGLLRAKSAKLKANDGMNLWLEHLILTLIHENSMIDSRLYGIDDTVWRFNPLSKEAAYQQLTNVVNGYIAGMSTPLLLPIRSAWQWLESCFDNQTRQISLSDKNRKKAKNLVIKTWYGNKNMLGECDDYYLRLIPELQDRHIDQIEEAAMQFLLPMKQSRSD